MNKNKQIVVVKKPKTENSNGENKNAMPFIIGCILICIVLLFTMLQMNITYVANLPLERNGAIPVNIQDQTTPAFDIFFINTNLSTITTLNNSAVIDSYSINLTNVSTYNIGDYIGIFETSTFYSATILNITANTLALDTPLDFNYTPSAIVAVTNRELNVDGSVNRIITGIALPGSANISVDITRIMFKMICTDPPEFPEFCDIPDGLTRGIVLRRTDGINQNYFNVKTNGDLANLMFDFLIFDQTKQQGVNGVVARLTYGGQSKHGVVIRLDPGDSLDLIIQDDLTSLVSFRIIAEGHIVTD